MNKTNKILIGSVSALCIVGTLTLLKAVFNDGGKMVTDWISALSNATMAGAAVYAALQAKKWFKQKKYEIAHSIAKDLTYTLYEMQTILDNFDAHVTMFTASSTAQADINEIKLITDKFCQLISKKERMLFELKRLHWVLKSEYDEIYYLPSCLDFETLICQVNLSLVMYEFDNTDSAHLEYDIRQINDPIKQYEAAIKVFLSNEIEYEEYFDIKK